MLELLKKISDLDSDPQVKTIIKESVHPEMEEYQLDHLNPTVLSDASVQECMMTNNDVDKSASINMTAASGEELGDVLQAILNLAGVKTQDTPVTTSPADAETNIKSIVTGVEDGPSDNRPLEELSPFAALAGVAARAAVGNMVGSAVKSTSDSTFNDKEGQEYHYYKDELAQEEYDNTPNKAYDVMNITMNDLAYEPNKGDHRPRQAGLALANPEKDLKETYDRLLKDYKTFDSKKKNKMR